MPLFPDLDALEAYVDTNITANGVEAITGPINNTALNGCIEFIRKSPLNWAKALVVINDASPLVLADEYLGVVVINGSLATPISISWGDNIYNQYVFINQTATAIPLVVPSVYYGLLNGQAIDNIPANTAITVFKAKNDLWVQGDNMGTSTGTAQKQPQTYIVGTTPGAPTVGASTWTLPAFANSWVVLILARSIIVDMTDAGDGGAFITKLLGSSTLTITNWTWQNGDILSYILITP